MEAPECPVCLQTYEFVGESVPRVLPCGHSLCESCLRAFPRRPFAAASTIRCPSCNILVRIPDLGPSALPKNIDLLRFCSPTSPSLHHLYKTPNPHPDPFLLPFPFPWSEDLYSKWKDLIIPHHSISLLTFDSGLGTSTASFYSSSLKSCKVILLPLANFTTFSAKCGQLRLSYIARVMNSMHRIGEDQMSKLRLLVDASLTCRRGISRLFGLWMNAEEEISPLFIVCERFDEGVSDVLHEEKSINEMVAFPMMAMEMCEAVITLHSEWIVCGCFLPDCFVFDELGHCILDLSRVLVCGKRIRLEITRTSVFDSAVFASPEAYFSLHGGVSAADCGFNDFVSYGSDVWSLACIMAMILFGDPMLGKELFQGFCDIFSGGADRNLAQILFDHYEVWREKVVSKLEALLLETKLESLIEVLKSSLSYQPQNRPQVKELWCCIRSLLTKTQVASLAAMDFSKVKESIVSCLIIGDMCSMPSETNSLSTKLGLDIALVNDFNGARICSSRHLSECAKQDRVNAEHSEGLDDDNFRSVCIEAHNDCITALAVGGGYLFSGSFDKTIKMWSLQDFSLVQTLKGHEHKIMAIVVIDGAQTLCISGDSLSGIFVWHIGISGSQELLKSWYEHNDWRYSGIHSLAVSGTSHLYSGGGDKSIKSWSLQVWRNDVFVKSIKIQNGAIFALHVDSKWMYVGGWDKIVSIQELLEDEFQVVVRPVASLDFDSVITSLLHRHGKLFVGFSNKIKVFFTSR